MQKPKAIAIVGPTSAGKTSLSIKIAQHTNGEVISADSRQVYRGMDLGTGKVTKEEMGDVPHHLLDVADPMEVFTGSDFVAMAAAAMDDIHGRGRHPIIAGGTFFYVDLLRGKLSAAPVEPNQSFRDSLQSYSDAELFELLKQKDPNRANTIDPHNRRRLIRALEIIHTLGSVPEPTKSNSKYDWLVLGIEIEKETLHQNIYTRILERIEEGMIEEVASLHEAGVTWARMDELGLEYRYISKYLQGYLTKDEMIELLNTRTRQFAKRQLTWLKRDTDIEWINPAQPDLIMERVDAFLTA